MFAVCMTLIYLYIDESSKTSWPYLGSFSQFRCFHAQFLLPSIGFLQLYGWWKCSETPLLNHSNPLRGFAPPSDGHDNHDDLRRLRTYTVLGLNTGDLPCGCWSNGWLLCSAAGLGWHWCRGLPEPAVHHGIQRFHPLRRCVTGAGGRRQTEGKRHFPLQPHGSDQDMRKAAAVGATGYYYLDVLGENI